MRFSDCLAVVVGVALFTGCGAGGASFEETEEGRVSRVATAGQPDSDIVGRMAPGEAVAVANRELGRRVRRTEGWSLVYCRPVTLRAGLRAYAVRFDRKGAYEDSRAGDKFAKFYVLADGRVLVADITYAE